MREFLTQENVAFYHITLASRWENMIQQNGLRPRDGRIFVSRTNDRGILYGIAIGQLPEIYAENRIAILRLPQILNNFLTQEISVDMQSNEPTMPLQNIINRPHIPPNQIELVEIIEFDINEITRIAAATEAELNNNEMYQQSFDLIYTNVDNSCYRLTGIQQTEIIECP
ncbi:hypothetical protein [Aestuariibaculum suncheonense]|uniref:Uncharacterized protein n=1 Tax=Aestuariibaculum suncheonense TaxID=1028745 RepID=A0A8J6Q526_9FLAO|nr:hypothetical protein [Aestuariibaculum suncheonense]MBD0835223.1 hypothetical protein [Aestuariibaculum suncheonense]